MSEYIFRNALTDDIPFLADTVIAAEKSNSDKLGFTTLFNVPEAKAKELVIAMLEEEIEGCELSVSSYIVAVYNGEAVAAFGGWIEGFGENMPSKILKSNLISYTFGRESIEFLKEKAHILKDMVVEREPGTLQLEYLLVSENHRGKKLGDGLIQALINRARGKEASLQKVQVQVFGNNTAAIKLYERNGFTVAKKYQSKNDDVFDYLPFNEKYLMEKTL